MAFVVIRLGGFLEFCHH